MSRRFLSFMGLIGLLGLLLGACGGQTAPAGSPLPQSPDVPVTPTPPTLPPTQTPTPTPTLAPPFTPAERGTPLPENLTPLSPANVDSLTLIARWGKGSAGPAAWTADGRALVVPANQGAYVYDAQTLAEIRYLPAISWEDYASVTIPLELLMGTQIEIEPEVLYASASAHLVALSPDGRWMAVGFADGIGKVRVLDLSSGTVVAVIDEPQPLSLAFSPDGRYLAVGSRGLVSLWEMTPNGPHTKQWFAWLESSNAEAFPAFTMLRFSPDGTWLAAISDSHDKGYLWRVEAGEHRPTQTIGAEDEGVSAAQALAFAPDGSQVVLGGNDGTLRIWDLAQGKALPPQATEAPWISALAFTPEGNLWIGTLSGDVLEWDLSQQHTLAHWRADPSLREVTQIALSPDGTRLLIQKAGSLLEVWDVASRERMGSLTDHWGRVRTSAYAPQAHQLALAVKDTVIVVDAITGVEKQRLIGGGHEVSDVALAPDGRWLIAAYEDEAVKLWDLSTGEVRFEFHPSSTEAVFLNTAAVAFSPLGTYAASLGYLEDAVTLWDPSTGQAVRTLTGAPEESWFIAFDATGQRLLAVSSNQQVVRVWDVASGNVIGDFALEADEAASGMPLLMTPYEAQFTPDGQELLLCGGGIPPLVALDAETGEVMWLGEGPGSSLDISPDGLLVTTGELLLDGHTGAALKVVFQTAWESFSDRSFFSADGTRLYIVTTNGHILVWGIPQTP